VIVSPRLRPISPASSAAKATSGGPAYIVGPPCARHDLIGGRCGGGIGHAPVAPDHPVIARHFAGALAVDLGDHAAQHRRGLHPADGGVICDAVEEGLQLVGLDVDEEIRGRDGRQVALDRGAQVAVDLADGGQHRKPETEGKHDAGGLRPRPADGAQRSAQRGAPAQAMRARARRRDRARMPRAERVSRSRAPTMPPAVPSASRGMPESHVASPISATDKRRDDRSRAGAASRATGPWHRGTARRRAPVRCGPAARA
jgi:hypothetical protein